ncbi:predicted protein [Plenodomus lingam JN3]|uniref:Predicted protein n=1 Tax=Leptosphaeria maculans (strain JN3 / isolate v23.1.3 / race Av1-4-5-6-7-8) TaxID=985895 RepID=E4ZK37_LEPMJ|nr:predicted protein [Plenodomus lingam JN3]CBX91632.1 predicted protein [Plenodomus lingam JN3]
MLAGLSCAIDVTRAKGSFTILGRKGLLGRAGAIGLGWPDPVLPVYTLAH